MTIDGTPRNNDDPKKEILVRTLTETTNLRNVCKHPDHKRMANSLKKMASI